MRQRFLVSLGCAALLAGSVPRAAGAADRDPDLARGIQLVEAGQWQQGLVPLGNASRRLAKDKKRAPEAAEAFLYAGLAHVGLGDTNTAIAQFVLALKRSPQVAIPASQISTSATDAFEVARREAVAVQGPDAKKRSPVLFIAGGAVLAGAGIAVAAGGGSSAAPSNGLPPVFTVTGATGAPQPVLQSAVPPPSSTVDFSESGVVLTFAIRDPASAPAHVQILVDMQGPQGVCIAGHSEVAPVERGASVVVLDVAGWTISCANGFTTTTMTTRLLDADAKVPVAATTYSGGYVFKP